MPGDSRIAAIRDYYELANEQDRLDDPQGQIEFERTKEIIQRHLPPPPAIVADVGGGPGRYTLWLAKLGYQVLHRDLMPLHVSQLRQAANGHPHIHSAIADARQLDLADRSADVVLLLGPLYHLEKRRDRIQVLTEAQRVARPGARSSRPRSLAGPCAWMACCGPLLREGADRP
jgi:ubiquinone/menaquinone biosynthesis C-methylase UbiE